MKDRNREINFVSGVYVCMRVCVSVVPACGRYAIINEPDHRRTRVLLVFLTSNLLDN